MERRGTETNGSLSTHRKKRMPDNTPSVEGSNCEEYVCVCVCAKVPEGLYILLSMLYVLVVLTVVMSTTKSACDCECS